MGYTKKLTDIRRDEHEVVGRRAADLASCQEHRVPIPQAFVVLADALDTLIRENNLKPKIDFLLQHVKTSDAQSLMNVYTSVRRMLTSAKLPVGLEPELREMFETITAQGMGLSGEHDPARVIVSTNAPEDSESNDTIIQNVHGIDEFLIAVREAWALSYLPSQLRYRMIGRYDEKKLRVALIVEAMPKVTASIHAYSAVPQDHDKLYLQVYYGYPDLRERVTKDYYAISRDGLQIVNTELVTQPSKLELQGPDMILVQMPARAKDDKLNRREIEEIARLAKKAHGICESPIKAFFSWSNEQPQLLWISRLPFAVEEKRQVTMGTSAPVEVVDLPAHSVQPQESAKHAIEEIAREAEEKTLEADARLATQAPSKLLAMTWQIAMRAIERRHQQIYGQTGDDFVAMIEQLNKVSAYPRPLDAQLLKRVHEASEKGMRLSHDEEERASAELGLVLG